MGITRLSRPLGAVLGALGLSFWAMHGSVSDPKAVRPVIVVLGFGAPGDDGTMRSISAPLAKSLDGTCAEAQTRYVQSGYDDAAKAAAVRQALELKPSVIVAPTAGLAMAAKAQTQQVPIVFSAYLDPVRLNIVSREQARAEAITGVALDAPLLAKQLDILHEAFPAVKKIGVLADAAWLEQPDALPLKTGRVATAPETVLVVEESPDRVVARMTEAGRQGVEAWVIPATQIGYRAQSSIIAYLRAARVPAMHATTQEVSAGALMAYAQDTSFAHESLARLTNRVCNGERAGDIPIERPRRFILSVRSRYDLGDLRIARSVVARADLVE